MKLNALSLAWSSVRHYWRTSLAVLFAVAVATAVLVGALVVGSSMRGSLRAMTLERLGRVDEVLLSRGFFSQALVEKIRTASAGVDQSLQVEPLILFPAASLERSEGKAPRRSQRISVLGIEDGYWQLSSEPLTVPRLSPDEIVLNEAVAEELGITVEQVASKSALVTLRIPKPSLLPGDSSLGKKRDLVESLVRLRVVAVIPNRGLGRFSLEPSQALARNVYVSLETLQSALADSALRHKGDTRQVNALLLARSERNSRPDAEFTLSKLAAGWQPDLADLGLRLKRVTQSNPNGGAAVFDYLSLTTEQLVFEDGLTAEVERLAPRATRVLTYLVNETSRVGAEQASGIPYSMFSALPVDEAFTLQSAEDAAPLETPDESELILNEWAAADLQAKPGDRIRLRYFQPESTHGQQVELTTELRLKAVAKLTRPSRPFQARRSGPPVPAEFTQVPTPANDPDLTPEVPGLTDSDSIENWDLPFETTGKIRRVDDQYWDEYRTTPKGFVNPQLAERIWGSRFGRVTGFRVPLDVGEDSLRRGLQELWRERPELFGWSLLPVKRLGLQAASGSTPFDGLFLGLSLFVIASALILTSLLFRLGLDQRAQQLGLLAALGFPGKQTVGLWSVEVLLLGSCGAVLGAIAGIGYARLIIWGLQTFWVGAISRPFLQLFVDWPAVIGGTLLGLLVSWLTILWSISRAQRVPARELLGGRLEAGGDLKSRSGIWQMALAVGLVLGACGLSFAATRLGGDSQAGAFMGAGFLVLVALLLGLRVWLRTPPQRDRGSGMGLRSLAWLNTRRHPRRTLLTVGLIAVATFLIVAISSFRLRPDADATGGITWIAESAQPIFADLSTPTGQDELLGEQLEGTEWRSFYSLRVKPGQDASCNNLYQATQPRVLGVPAAWIERFDRPDQIPMAWAGSLATTPESRANPWRLLEGAGERGAEEPIPCVIDKNTAMYSLKIYTVGQTYRVQYDSGEKLTFKVVGFLDNSLLQGSLIIGERDFVRAFPYLSGYRMFLIDADETAVRTVAEALADEGFDPRTSLSLLDQFMAVQNTYLSAFQALGGLGLLLGTLGLAAVQLRSIFERRRELALMQALGYRLPTLTAQLFWEQAWVLLAGLGIGLLAAAAATVPHLLVGMATVPWGWLLGMFGLIALVGLFSGLLAARSIMRLPLVGSLRGE